MTSPGDEEVSDHPQHNFEDSPPEAPEAESDNTGNVELDNKVKGEPLISKNEEDTEKE